jgi:hypothetical protein
LLPHLRLNKPRKRLTHKSKGFSSIVGAVFAALIMISLIATVFVWSLSENTRYNNTVRQANQADSDRQSEKVVANVTARRVDDNNVAVNGTLQNEGPLSVEILTLWVQNTNRTTYAYKDSLGITLKSGSVTYLSGSMTTVLLANSLGDNLDCWFISGRGSIIHINPLFGNLNLNINYSYPEYSTISNVSMGIGIIGFDFKQFFHFDTNSSSTPANNYNLGKLADWSKTYATTQGQYTIFHVTLTSYDPTLKTMYVYLPSAIYVIGSHSGTVKFDTWKLVNVTGDPTTGLRLNPTYSAQYVLPHETPVDVYFAGTGLDGGAIDSGYIYPLNIMVFGKLGTSDYGQNVPFVTLYFR